MTDCQFVLIFELHGLHIIVPSMSIISIDDHVLSKLVSKNVSRLKNGLLLQVAINLSE